MELKDFSAMRSQPGVARSNSCVVLRRSSKTGNDQLSHPAPRTRRLVRRTHLWSLARLGMRVRQVQKNSQSRNYLRKVRRAGCARARPPRTHGTHRTSVAGLALVVRARRAVAHRFDSRFVAARARTRVVFRAIHCHESGRRCAQTHDATPEQRNAEQDTRTRSSRPKARSRTLKNNIEKEIDALTRKTEAAIEKLEEQLAEKTDAIVSVAKKLETRIDEAKGSEIRKAIVFEPTDDGDRGRRRNRRGKTSQEIERTRARSIERV